MAEAINRSWTHWFGIPVSNFDRAKTFYETIYNMKIDSVEAGALKTGIFPHRGLGMLFVLVKIIHRDLPGWLSTWMQIQTWIKLNQQAVKSFKPKNQFLKNTVSCPCS